MFISGHEEILEDAIKASGMIITNETLEQLRKGIVFPDLSCATFSRNPKFKSGIEIQQRDHCSWTKLLKILHGKEFGFSTIYQFQRGALTMLHSMSHYLDTPTKVVREHILATILALLVTCAHGEHGFAAKSPFWIGIILHIMTDSYPKSHTLREGYHSEPLVLPYNTTEFGKTKTARRIINNQLVKIARDDDVYNQDVLINELKAKLANVTSPEILYYLTKKQSSIHHSYLIYKFLRFNKTTSGSYMRKLGIPRDVGIYSHSSKQYDLIGFQSYDFQSGVFHKKEDLLSSTKSNPIYNSRILPEVITVLRKYNDFLQNKLTDSEFIRKTFIHIATTTFSISAKSAKHLPAFPLVGLSNEFKIKKIIKRYQSRTST
jgi:hypothetical protein